MIITIGFEGPNRVGKGTQIDQLSRLLSSLSIPYLVIRGDGSRPAKGSQGDPTSLWWDSINPKLHTLSDPLDWELASCRLVREMIVWRKRVLPRMVKAAKTGLGVLLVDRSIISRAQIVRETGSLNLGDLYPQAILRKRKISAEMVCPDIIFVLTAPVEMLLARLDPNDPKYNFRRSLINTKGKWYEDITWLPRHIQERVVTIESTKTADIVAGEILHQLLSRFPILGNYKTLT